MNASAGSIFKVVNILSVMIIFLLSGCKPAPPSQTVKDLLAKHFETEKYHVVQLDIGEITSLSPGEKTYMGTPGYIVHIKSITLEIKQDIGSSELYKKGQQVTFKSGRIRIREQTGQPGEWIITGISGIPVL